MEEDLLLVCATKPTATARLTGQGLGYYSEGAEKQHGNGADHLRLELLMGHHPGGGFSHQSASGKDAPFKVLYAFSYIS